MNFQAVLLITVVFFAMIGLAFVIRSIAHAIFCKGMPGGCVTLIMLSGSDADMSLRSALEQISYDRMLNTQYIDCKILAVNDGLSPQTAKICRIMCEDCSVQMCDIDELGDMLKKIGEQV